MKLIRKAIL